MVNLYSDYITFTEIEDLDLRVAPATHPYTINADTFYRTIPLYAFRSMEDARTAMVHLNSRTFTDLVILEDIVASRNLGHWG